MSGSITEQKTNLRARIRSELKKMSATERAAASAQAINILESQSIWQQAAAILFYAPLPQELDIWPLVIKSLATGKTVALPRFNSTSNTYVACKIQNLTKDLEAGHLGIREPKAYCPTTALNKLDLVLVPGLAFDLQGRRLGRGKGFYDRLLAAVRGITCGIAFDRQILSEIPREPHDLIVNCILTPTRWIEPKQRAVSE